MGERPIPPRERLGLMLAGGALGVLAAFSTKLLHWWIIWSSAQLDAIAALLGWR